MKLFLVILAIALTSYLTLPFFGTSDMSAWVRSAAVNLTYGPTQAYDIYNMYYPPLSSTIIWATALISDFHYSLSWLSDYPSMAAIGPSYLPIKYSILFFLILSLLSLYVFTGKRRLQDSLLTFFNPALLWSTLILGYIDIYIVPALILSYYYFNKKKDLFAGALLAITFLIKLIPIFLVPVFFIAYTNLRFQPFKLRIAWHRLIKFSLGLTLVTFMTFVLYSPRSFGTILVMSALHGQYLSLNSLNIYWLIREFFIPENLTPSIFLYLGKILFLGISGLSLIKLALSHDKGEAILRTSFCILFSYAMLFTGAHENHLFPAVIIALLMYFQSPTIQNKIWYYGVSAILFLNLFLFYRLGIGVPAPWLDLLFANTPVKLLVIDLVAAGAVIFYLYQVYDEIKKSLSHLS